MTPDEQATRANALVPFETLTLIYGVSRWTLDRWLTADEIPRYEYAGGKAVRWGDIPTVSPAGTNRWVKRTPENEGAD